MKRTSVNCSANGKHQKGGKAYARNEEITAAGFIG